MNKLPSIFREFNDDCLQYLRELKISKQSAYRHKILVVGRENVGKTTLVKNIVGSRRWSGSSIESKELDRFTGKLRKRYSVTDGIDVHRWIPNNSNVVLSVWDFGGQELYHTTHQFFLSPRTIYILVFDARIDLFENKIVEWLNCIQARSPGEVVALVGTHFDKKVANNKQEQINNQLKQLLSDMSRLTSAENQFKILKAPDGQIFWKVCTKPGREFGVTSLVQQIVEEGKRRASEVHVPSSWLTLRERLMKMREGLTVPIIDRKSLHAIAAELEVFDNHVDLACKLLEDWSEILVVPRRLHHSGDSDSELIIIDPTWMIDVFESVISLKYINNNMNTNGNNGSGSGFLNPNQSKDSYSRRSLPKFISKAISKVRDEVIIRTNDNNDHSIDNNNNNNNNSTNDTVTEYLISQEELEKRWRIKNYPERFFPVLMDLLQYHFELIAEVEPRQYIAPCLMRSVPEPQNTSKFWSSTDQDEVYRQYDFPFLPYGFFSRLCVEIIQRDRISWNNVWHVTQIWGSGLEIEKTSSFPPNSSDQSNVDCSTQDLTSTGVSTSPSLQTPINKSNFKSDLAKSSEGINFTSILSKNIRKNSATLSSLFSNNDDEENDDDISSFRESLSSAVSINETNSNEISISPSTSTFSLTNTGSLSSSSKKNQQHQHQNNIIVEKARVEIHHPNNSGTNCSLFLRTRGSGKKSGACMLILFHHVIMQLLQDYSGLSSRIHIFVGIRSSDPSKSMVLSRQDCIGNILLHKTVNPELAWLIPEMFPSTISQDNELDETERNYIASKEQYKHEVVLKRELGSGISGAVYEGTWLGHHVAVKLPHIDPSTIYRIDDFFQEVELLRSLDHPNILKFLYRYHNPPVVVTEFCSGGDLSGVFTVNTHIPEVLVIRICLDIACGLSYLHNHQPPILHGDIRPPNILIKELDAYAEVTAVIADVGNAQIADPISLTWNDKTTATDMSGFISIFEQLLQSMESQSDSDSEGSNYIELGTTSKLYDLYNEIKENLLIPFSTVAESLNTLYNIHKENFTNISSQSQIVIINNDNTSTFNTTCSSVSNLNQQTNVNISPSQSSRKIQKSLSRKNVSSASANKNKSKFAIMVEQLNNAIDRGDHDLICGVLRVAHSRIPFSKCKRRWVEFSQILVKYNTKLIRSGDSVKLQEILEIGFIDVAEPIAGMYLIHFAAESGQLNCLKMIFKMLNTSPNVRTKTVSGNAALHLSVSQGHTECAQYLLKSNADVDVVDNKGQTPLLKAARGAFYDCMQLLLTSNANPNIKNSMGESPLSVTAGFVQTFNPKKDANFRCVILLLCNQADLPLSIDKHSKNVIRSAAQILLSSYWTSVIIYPKVQTHLQNLLDSSTNSDVSIPTISDSEISMVEEDL